MEKRELSEKELREKKLSLAKGQSTCWISCSMRESGDDKSAA